MEIEKKALFSTEEVKAKADAEMQRCIEAGISDTVESLNGNDAPAFDQALVGKQIEVRCGRARAHAVACACSRAAAARLSAPPRYQPRRALILASVLARWAGLLRAGSTITRTPRSPC